MKIDIAHASGVGPVVRAVRKAQRMRQDDAAGSMGVSENFLGKIERGSESVHWGKLFHVLAGLGVRVTLDVPDDAAGLLEAQAPTQAPKSKRP
jgi:transcriptional regulator with XRE-family HTH domain